MYDKSVTAGDPAHNILGYGRTALDAIFAPKAVAVIGASEEPGSVGRTVLWNLISNPFGGTVFPVNIRRSSVLGIKAYRSVLDIPDQADMAVIATPPQTVPQVISECSQVGIKGAIILSAGFRERGEEGKKLESEILDIARTSGMRIIGPNCLGIMRPPTGLNATFAASMAKPGSVGFISQSGALCTAILDWSLRENVGFSAFISIGSMLDISWSDLIYYLGDDPHTNSILLYIESVGDARSFLSAVREIALTKPVIIVKAGRTEAAAKAAASHTGALAESDDVFDAAIRRVGALRVNSISDLFYISEVLSKQPRPKGKRLLIVTNAGGPGVLATDALISGGGELAALSEDTSRILDSFLPPTWSHGNPVDILGDADADRYNKAMESVVEDPNADGLLVILTPQAMTEPTRTAQALVSNTRRSKKPVLASWMGAEMVAEGERVLNNANIPTFRYPDVAVRMFNYMWQYNENLRLLYETPSLASTDISDEDRQDIANKIQECRNAGRTVLTEWETKQILNYYSIPTVRTIPAHTLDEALEAAIEIGYPVVVKLLSNRITHKTDVGGVYLNITTPEGIKDAWHTMKSALGGDFDGVTVQPMIKESGYELIIGSSVDPQFGPVLLFGSGGQLVEVYRDRELGLPPLNTTLARRMMERTKIFQALLGVRGRKRIDINALEQIIVRFSQLVVDYPEIKEIEINPLLASSNNILALDARAILHDQGVSSFPRPAIRPYPAEYIWRINLEDGTELTIRPIRAEDEPLIVRFHQTLSEESIYFRYFRMMSLTQRTAHERLTRICFIDYDREMALVAERYDPSAGSEIIGVARLSRVEWSQDAEFAMIISDKFQRRGIGTLLLSKLIEVAKREGIANLQAQILPENYGMQKLCRKLGFSIRHDVHDGIVIAKLPVNKNPEATNIM